MPLGARIRGYLRRLRIGHPPFNRDIRLDVDYLGSGYGGWAVSPSTLPARPVVYSFGVGEDLTFDIAMVLHRGARVWAFDPTPRSVTWIREQVLPDGLTFVPVGIAAQDGEMTFYPPAIAGYASFSAVIQRTSAGTSVIAPVRRLRTLMQELGHSSIDLLKLDIEGAEFSVLDDVISSGIRPLQVLVEFHPTYVERGRDRWRETVETLRREGYGVFWISPSGEEVGLVLTESLPTVTS